MLHWISDPQAWIALLTLTVLEIVLGIDNVVFISILASRLRPDQQALARRLGLFLALFGRLGLLFSLSAIMRLTADLFTVLDRGISGRDLILLGGGLFLLAKATHEIHQSLEGAEDGRDAKAATFKSVILQVIALDIVFSLDSVITAVGMAEHLGVMVIAMVVAVVVMVVSVDQVSSFIEEHPTVKMLALSFLLLVGVSLMAEGLDFHIPRGYIYFAMAFSVLVEMLNLRVAKRRRER